MTKLRLLFMLMFFSSTGALAEGPTFEYAFSPRQGATALVVKTIQAARKSVRVAAYELTSQPVAAALVSAHDRGVDVEVVVDKSQRKTRGSKISMLAEHDIPVRINDRYHIMHDKFILVDGTALELGSFNYTGSAERANAENVLVIHNSNTVIGNYARQWQKLWDEAKAH